MYSLLLRKLTLLCYFTRENTQTNKDAVRHIIVQLRWRRSIAPFVYYFSGVCAIELTVSALLPGVLKFGTKTLKMAGTGSHAYAHL